MAMLKILRVWQASGIFHFFNDFFQKIQHKTLHLEIQFIFYRLLRLALKNGSKVKKKCSESAKNDTKTRITRV